MEIKNMVLYCAECDDNVFSAHIEESIQKEKARLRKHIAKTIGRYFLCSSASIQGIVRLKLA